ncbi:MAG TPA: hypothetical protein V6D29_24295 [Leptolyngbyaceae cyanobacterium]
MKKLDYTSLFLSMVSLVWMLTMLQEFPVIESVATQEVSTTVAAVPSLVEAASADALKQPKLSKV